MAIYSPTSALRKVHYNKKTEEGTLGAYAMEHLASGAHLPNPWFSDPAKLRKIMMSSII